jgi:hypothetical protein
MVARMALVAWKYQNDGTPTSQMHSH